MQKQPVLLTTTLFLSHEFCEGQRCSQQCCSLSCAHLEEISCHLLKREMRKGCCSYLCLKFPGPCTHTHTCIQMEDFRLWVLPFHCQEQSGVSSLSSYSGLRNTCWSEGGGQCPLCRANVVVSQPYLMEGILAYVWFTLQTNTALMITHTVQYHSSRGVMETEKGVSHMKIYRGLGTLKDSCILYWFYNTRLYIMYKWGPIDFGGSIWKRSKVKWHWVRLTAASLCCFNNTWTECGDPCL